MRKLIKTLFSQLVIVSLLLILQVISMVWFVYKLSDYIVFIELALKIISLIVVIVIINRHSNPMYKLAWVIPILIFPLLGGFFYLFITGQMHTKYFFYKIQKNAERMTAPYSQDERIASEIEKTYPERLGNVKYINKTTNLCAYACEGARYFSSGEEMHSSLLEELKKAEKYIFLEYFILSDGVMWQSIFDVLQKKAMAGVDVRILYDGMGSMGLLPRSFPKEMAKHNIKCRIFSPFVPFLSATQNNRDHRKILVIDGKTAYTGGINIADEYINKRFRFGHWKDMAVLVRGRAAFSFAMMFLSMWDVASREKTDIKAFEPIFKEEKGQGYVMPYSDVPQDKFQVGKYIYLDIINRAKNYVYITTPYLILDNEMITSLTNASLSGVDVRIICPAIADHWYARAVAYSHYKELLESGVKIYEYSPGFIHGKTFSSDDTVSVVGSINLDYRSLYLHFECASYFLDSHITYAVRDDFIKTLNECKEITLEDCKKINPLKKVVNAFLRIFAPLM